MKAQEVWALVSRGNLEALRALVGRSKASKVRRLHKRYTEAKGLVQKASIIEGLSEILFTNC